MRSSSHATAATSAAAAAALYPVRVHIDVLTATYLVWSYRRLHRAVTALDALMHTPALPPPSSSLPPLEYSLAASLWQLQWAIESQESRFARSMLIPVEGNTSISLRAYVRGLKERMAVAVKRGLFDDIEEDQPAIEAKRAEESRELMLEARACLTFAFAHDVRWRRVVMKPPEHLFDERAPDRDRAAEFVDHCVALTDRFINGTLTLSDVAAEATDQWLYD